MSDDAPHPEITAPKITGEGRLPGDPTKDELVERMIRVDHAGEYGAVRIYAGQRAVLRHGAAARTIDEMADKEREHLATFDRLIGERRVRPTACSGAATTADTIEELRRQLLAQPVVRCDEPAWTMFGVSMAGYNAVASAALVAGCVVAVARMTRRMSP